MESAVSLERVIVGARCTTAGACVLARPRAVRVTEARFAYCWISACLWEGEHQEDEPTQRQQLLMNEEMRKPDEIMREIRLAFSSLLLTLESLSDKQSNSFVREYKKIIIFLESNNNFKHELFIFLSSDCLFYYVNRSLSDWCSKQTDQ